MRCHFNQTTTNFLALNWLTCVSPQTGFRPQDGKRKETNKQTKKPTNKQTKGSRGWKRRASIMLLLRHIQPRLLSFSYSPSKSSTLKKFIFSHLSYFLFSTRLNLKLLWCILSIRENKSSRIRLLFVEAFKFYRAFILQLTTWLCYLYLRRTFSHMNL